MPRVSYTLFLAKQARDDFEAYLSESARQHIGLNGHQLIEIEDLAERASLHVFRGSSGPPNWMRRLARRFPEVHLVNRQSVAALLFIRLAGHVVAISYSHGWMLLNDNMFHSDFGLLVAINSLDPEKLKRLERSNLGDAIQGVSQSPFQRDLNSFGVDDALDLVKKLSGAANNESGLDTVTGARSLKLTGEYSLDDVAGMLPEIFKLFNSDAYRQTAFRIMDSVRPITDAPLSIELFQMAVDSIKNDEDRFELGLPANSEAEGVRFRFAGPGLRRSYPDLLLRHYVAAMGEDLINITPKTLSDHKIVSQFDDDRPDMIWPLKKSLLGSITLNEQRYAINDGRWYRIDENFRNSVENNFTEAVRNWDVQRPTPLRKFYDQDGNGRIEAEDVYNARIAEELGLILLDKTEIQIPEVIRSGFEPCDLLDVEGRRFIHVKKNSRRSNILSHFFKQGSNSAQQFRKVPATWSRLADIVRDAGHEAAANTLQNQMEDAGQGWTVEFWIADAPRRNGLYNIPFFSKISLRDEVNSLQAMQYNVALRFIEVLPDNI